MRPKRPGTKAAARQNRRLRIAGGRLVAAQTLNAPLCGIVGDTASCAAYANRP